jgi:N-methylhydantoinase A
MATLKDKVEPVSPRTPGTLVGVDVGGTFTDFVVAEGARLRVHKVPSTPDDPARAVLQGLRELGIGPGTEIVHGSTVATNALIERKGARTALVTTAGFEDVLEIGRQERQSLYDFMVTSPEPLAPAERRFGVRERIGSEGQVIEALDEAVAAEVAERVRGEKAETVAVCLLFSFLQPDHERRIRAALERAGVGPYVYLSSEVLPEYREYERMSTTVINAYVAPVVDRYLRRLGDELGSGLRVMQSSGGSLTPAAAVERPVYTISGGPAGGVIGAFRVAREAAYFKVISFDMGGTSTDVALCDGRVPETTEWSAGGLPVKTPSVDVHSVGAGGGSIARIDAGKALQVGPESAGAVPGPACYGTGTLATVTDANLVLGRLGEGDAQGGLLALDRGRAEEALLSIAAHVGPGAVEAAEGVVRVANANMERAVRVVSVERGHDPRDFVLLAFGGAGPLHACDLAEALGIPTVLVPAHPGVLSAQGMAFADVTRQYSATVMLRGDELDLAAADRALDELVVRGRADMEAMGVARDGANDGDEGQALAHRSLDMRYSGQSFEVNIEYDRESPGKVVEAFHEAHRSRYGHANPDQPVEIVNVRVKMARETPVVAGAVPVPDSFVNASPVTRSVVFGGRAIETPVHARELLGSGSQLSGPAIVAQYDTTTVVPPGWVAWVDERLNLVVKHTEEGPN